MNDQDLEKVDVIEQFNIIELEQDDIGKHPCLASLVALIRFMQSKKMFELPEGALPNSLRCLKEKLSDDCCPINAKLFILKIILNCKEIFKPFATHFVGVILKVIISQDAWKQSPMINYFSLDLLTMLITWSDVAIPNADSVQRALASRCINELGKSARNASTREVMRYTLDLSSILISKWRSILDLDYDELYKMFNERTDLTKNTAGVHMLGFLASNEVAPFKASKTPLAVYFKDFTMNLDSHRKEVYQATAEVCGLSIKYFKEKQLDIELETLTQMVLSSLTKLQKIPGARAKEKYIHCLYMTFQHYPEIVENFAASFVYSLPQLPQGTPLRQSVEMLKGAMNYFEANIGQSGSWKKELSMTNIKNYIHGKGCNTKVQLAALGFVEKIVNMFVHSEPNLAQELLLDLKSLVHHSWIEIRRKVQQILQLLWLEKVENVSQLIMNGLTDSDATIAKETVDFVNEHFLKRLDKTTDRIKFLLKNILQPTCKDAFLSIFCDLSLAHTETSHLIKKVLFISLSEQKPIQFDIDPSWRSQFGQSIAAPMFAETLSSTQSSQKSSGSMTNMVNATQTSFEFTQTQTSGTMNATGTGRQFMSSIVASTQISSIEEGQFKISPQDNSFGLKMSASKAPNIEAIPQSGVRIGKRFTKVNENKKPDLESAKSYFARLHQRKVNRKELMEKERKGRRHAQVTLRRNYRIGELPDVEITSADVLNPLRFLCYLDNEVAEMLGMMILKGIIINEENHFELENLIMSQVVKKELMNKHLGRCLLETCLEFDAKQIENIDEPLLEEMSKKLQLQMHGILLLEKKPKSQNNQAKVRRKDVSRGKMSRETVLSLLNLHKSLDDPSSARGIFIQEFPANETILDKIENAMSFESLQQYNRSKKIYKELITGNEDPEMKDFLTEQYIGTLEKLSSWGDIADHLNDEHIMNSQFLPNFVKAACHLQVEREGDENILKGLLEKDQNLMKEFPYETASVHMLKNDLRRKDQWSDLALKKAFKAWTEKNQFHFQSYMNILNDMQLATNFVKGLDLRSLGRQLGQDLQANDHLICQWKIMKRDLVDKISLQQAFFQCLDVCHCLGQVDVSIKLLKSLVSEDKSARSTPKFFHHETRATIGSCLNPYTSIPFEVKFSTLHRSCMNFDEKASFKELPGKDQAVLKSSVLNGLASLISDKKDPELKVLNLLKSKDPLEEQRKKSHFRNLIGSNDENQENIIWALKAKSIQELQGSFQDLDPEGHLTLANYCYDLIQTFPERIDETAIQTFIKSHAKSMEEGSPKAIKLFPRLLILLETYQSMNKIKEFVQNTLESLPSWMVLPWANQLLALLQINEMADFIYPLVLKMADEFPQALWFAFNFVKKEVHANYPELTAKLKLPAIVEKFVNSLDKLSLPVTRAIDFIDKLSGSDDPETLMKQFEASNFSDQTNAERLFFNEEIRRKLRDCCRKVKAAKDIKKKLVICAEIKTAVKKDSAKKKGIVSKLSDLSRFLSTFSKNDFLETLEIPGQYEMKFHPIDTRKTVKIAGFKNSVKVFGSLRQPIKISMIGDDGKDYDFIIKGGEDIRQDQRIQQAFNICNHLADGSIVTYNVIPITTSLGMLQFVPNTSTLQDLIPENLVDIKKTPNPFPVWNKDDLKKSLKTPDATQRGAFQKEVVEKVLKGGFQLRDEFMRRAFSHEGFFYLRKNFMKSHGEVCMIGYILGIGDRHAQNTLISTSSGKSVAIDFGYSFGSTFGLAIPELAQFRLTPVIQGLMYPFRDQGPFKDAMTTMLKKLKVTALFVIFEICLLIVKTMSLYLFSFFIILLTYR